MVTAVLETPELAEGELDDQTLNNYSECIKACQLQKGDVVTLCLLES